MQWQFTKMHGLGNDFVLIDATRAAFAPDKETLARLADRRLGVGCDQILVLDPAPSDDVDFGYRIFNADGSEVSQCGNGARCLAKYVRDAGLIDADSLRVSTRNTRMEMRYAENNEIRVNMGVPVFEPQQVPFDVPAESLRYALTLVDQAALEIGVLSMGNPHAVMLVSDLDHAPVDAVGQAIQAHPAFPESVNAGFLQVLSPQHARLRVYERGAGETMACGSGACAAAVIGQRWQVLSSTVRMELPGGSLKIEWAGEGAPVYMTGPAETVYRGEIEIP